VKTVLVTGGAGFFGEILKRQLLAAGHRCISIDLQRDEASDPNLETIQGDIRDADWLDSIFRSHRFDAVCHCAAMLAHTGDPQELIWSCNVDGTERLAEACVRHHVPKIVFTSTNCLWAEPFNRPVTEDDEPRPREIYGASKWAAEQALRRYQDRLASVIIRTPTIMDSGRLGLLAILFEFISEGRRVWMVGGGHNRYQFVYAADLADACIRALDYPRTIVLNVGSDNVRPLREVYEYVIARANTGARIASLPRWPTLSAMQLAHRLRMSPLGPYQYRMIAEDFIFDTSRVKRELRWVPTLTNGEMLFRAYQYYHLNRREIHARTAVSAHKQPAKMGVIRLLKWVS
jgi:nucleoside-diphosphate-sugar epimerase